MLENVKYRLEKDKKLTVVYLGGSITEGAGASDYAHCWAALMSDYFVKQYPDCDIQNFNSGIGGTGSELGAYRCENDVLAHKPDLVFYEFAVNDFWVDPVFIENSCDAILHKIRTALPYCDIVFLYTTTKTVSEHLAGGGIYASRTIHTATAYRYGDIVQIDIGEVLRNRFLTCGNDYSTLLPDTTHPNDEGHALYFETIRRKLEDTLRNAEAVTAPIAHKLPPVPVSDYSFYNAHMTDAFLSDFSGFDKIEKTFYGKYPHYIEAVKPGATITFTFTGRKLDLFCARTKDSGDIWFSIDGSPETYVSTWDKYCLNFDRPAIVPFSPWLSEGTHTVTMRVSDRKDPSSEGYAVRIAAFLVN